MVPSILFVFYLCGNWIEKCDASDSFCCLHVFLENRKGAWKMNWKQHVCFLLWGMKHVIPRLVWAAVILLLYDSPTVIWNRKCTLFQFQGLMYHAILNIIWLLETYNVLPVSLFIFSCCRDCVFLILKKMEWQENRF